MKSGRAEGDGFEPGALRMTKSRMTTTGSRKGRMDFTSSIQNSLRVMVFRIANINLRIFLYLQLARLAPQSSCKNANFQSAYQSLRL